MSKETGGPAFPVHPGMASALGCCPSSTDTGMSLRDYFAAKAMPTGLAHATTVQGASIYAYQVADAMMEARK